MWRVRGLRVSLCLCLLPCPPSRCLLLLLVPVSPRCPLSIHLSLPLALLITCAPLSRLCPSPAPSLLMLSHPSLPRGSVLHPSQRSSSSASPRRLLHPSLPNVPIHLSISVHIDLSTSARSPPHPSPVHGSSCCTQPSQLTLRSSLPGASIHRSSILAHIPPSISSQTSPPVRLWIWFLLIHPSSHLCTPLSVAALTPPSTPSPASFTCPSLCTTPALHLSSHSIHPFPLGASSTCPSQHSFCACPSPPTPLLPSLPRQSTHSCARLSLFLLTFLHPSHLLGYIPALLPVRVRLCSHASIQPFLVVSGPPLTHPSTAPAKPSHRHPPCPITTSLRAARR